MSSLSAPLRIVACHDFPPAYEMVADWVARHGHQIVLLVTSPKRPEGWFGEGYRELVASLPTEQDVLITGRPKRVAAPLIAALAPDLLISATFPQRIPPEVTAIPRFGAVNLHPAPLPRGRGPNPGRLLYEGDLTVAGSLHRIGPEFDAGPVLSRHERRLPPAVTPELVSATWGELLTEALDEGVARAVAGEWGEPQDDAQATYAAPYTDEERRLRWDEPALTLQRRAAALNLTGPSARASIDDQEVTLLDVRARPGSAPPAAPGTVLERAGDRVVVRVADGVVEATLLPTAEMEPGSRGASLLAGRAAVE